MNPYTPEYPFPSAVFTYWSRPDPTHQLSWLMCHGLYCWCEVIESLCVTMGVPIPR